VLAGGRQNVPCPRRRVCTTMSPPAEEGARQVSEEQRLLRSLVGLLLCCWFAGALPVTLGHHRRKARRLLTWRW